MRYPFINIVAENDTNHYDETTPSEKCIMEPQALPLVHSDIQSQSCFTSDPVHTVTSYVHGKMRQTDSGSFVEEMVNQIEKGTSENNTPQLRYAPYKLVIVSVR